MLKEVKNFRDLGGIKTGDGRRVKKGLFYRSAMLNAASPEDIEFLKSLNLKIIFDYRDEDEITIMKTNPYDSIGAKYLNHPAGLNNDKLYRLKKIPYIMKAFQRFTLDDVKNTYKHLPFNNVGYKAMVKAMVDGELPFLQHCSAGKDRAGMGSAIVLAILGVEYEEILKDYMKSLDVRKYLENLAMGFVPKIIRKPILKRYEPLFIVDKELLDTALEAINDRYGSMESYFLSEYGLDDKMIKDLRYRYTE